MDPLGLLGGLSSTVSSFTNPINAIGGALKGTLNLFGIGTGKRSAAKKAEQQFEHQKELQELAIQKQKEANLELSDYAFDREVEMWNKQNEYNSPAAQMARFKAAGLNPALIYGQGSSGNATSLPSYNAPQVSRADYGNPVEMEMQQLAAYNNIAFQRAQIDNLNAQTDKTEAETGNIIPTLAELYKHQIDKLSAEEKQILQNIDQRAELHKFELQGKELSNKFMSGQISMQEFQQQLLQVDIDVSRKKLDLMGAEISNLKAREVLNLENAAREQFIREKILPIAAFCKEEELKKLRFENKIDEKTYLAQVNQIYGDNNLTWAKLNREQVETAIAEIEEEIMRDYGTRTNPWWSLVIGFANMLGISLNIFSKVRGKKGTTTKTVVPTSGGGSKTVITKS